ncbi:MAG TPA: lipid II flippase MurJ [Candidatus Sulfotelmatobacter sp.]|nr:lipid II flippase MurJ [Candidatus Sulfotelmatobacter sp.]
MRMPPPLVRLIGAVEPYVPRGALLLASLTLGEAVMGLLRDRVLARSFGAGPALDAYTSAAIVPGLLLDIVVVGGVQAALLPLFTRLRREDEAAAQLFGRTIVWVGVVAMVVVAVGLLAGAPLIAAVAVPGFDPAGRDQYVTVLRLLAVTPAIFAAAIAIGELLVAHRRFLGYGLGPVLYNGGIAGGAFLLAGPLGIAAPAVGAIVGAVFYLAVRVWDLRATRLSLRPAFAIRTGPFREFLVLMVPRMIGQPVDDLTHLVGAAIASTLAAGSVTAVVFAWNFESGAVSIVGVAFSVVAFPSLAAAAAEGDRRRFFATAGRAGLAIVTLSGAGAILMALLAGTVIRVFLGGQAFDETAVARTSATLIAFALAIPLESLTQLLARAVYATENTLLPVAAAVIGFGVMAVLAPLLVGRLGVTGVPLAYAAGFAVRVLTLGLVAIDRGRGLRPPAGAPTGPRPSAAPPSSAPPR